MVNNIPLEEVLERFKKVYNGAVSDMLDSIGYRDQVLPKELTPLNPEVNFCGTALTVNGQATHSKETEVAFVPLLKMLGDVQKNNVVVIQPNDDICSHLGELASTTIKARGGVGAVIYGGARDIDYVQKLGLPLYKLYTTPVDIVGRWYVKEYNVPIRIKNVNVNPGDIIKADKDGVVVIPLEVAEEILLKSEELLNTENHVRNDVQNGVHPLESFYKHGWF
ncbi:RraA family protein [Alicyclobacillus fastidiosus]|uniref:Putative 4-hydroxy-4-methyl-2-oxoglutarate aldolase n=1 Tax=Alicyclobacillus fastidiosus TaxID=392011 RepID=A0ABY6ZND5_9BACL|nr:RraA family protein [Alicyclobacillus fastidiosus]WAH44389.1 RraA family protein [Alicyclobacillus fastidiosus]GMA60724.1 demethylmenaquinone methyltransferase [Alicyclobacillus fastidiosus]